MVLASVAFDGVVSHFVKTVGRDVYQPVPSLTEADNCFPLGILVKKRKNWFWQSPKYRVTDFQLHELLTNQTELGIDMTTKNLVTYNRTSNFSMDGHIGSTVQSFIDVNIKGTDKVTIEANFGQLVSKEFDGQDLINKIRKRRINMEHPLIKQVKTNPNKVLCLIVGTAVTTADNVLKINVNYSSSIEGKSKGFLSRFTSLIGGTSNSDLDVQDNTQRTVTIPKNTPLAFESLELKVSTDGAFQAIFEPDVHGGFEISRGPPPRKKSKIAIKSQDKSTAGITDLAAEVCAKLSPFITSKNRVNFNAALLRVLKQPKIVKATRKIIRRELNGSQLIENTGDLDPYIKDNFEIVSVLLHFLEIQSKDGKFLSAKKSSTLEAGSYLFDGLNELDDDVILSLANCSKTAGANLLKVLKQAINKVPIIEKMTADKIYLASNPAQAILNEIGFKYKDKELQIPCGLQATTDIHGCYIVAHCLWGEC